MQTLFQDLRFGVRMLLKSKAFALVTLFSLALGIGANTALFSVMDAVLLKTLPVKEPERLTLLRWRAGESFEIGSMSGSITNEDGKATSNMLTWPLYEQLQKETQSLASLCAFFPLSQINVNTNNNVKIAQGQIVTGNYFSTLGVQPLLGRLLEESDDQVAAAPAVVLSHRYWQSRFGADQNVIGKQISLNQKPFTIVGVTPPEFFGALNVGYAADLTVSMASELFESRMKVDVKSDKFWWVMAMGRLKPDVSREQAQAEMNTLGQTLLMTTQAKTVREQDRPQLMLDSGSQGLMDARKAFSAPLKILMAVVFVALFIACLNIANLTLARATTRQKELAVRLAAGATRFRLIRQLLTESVLLSLIGGALGILFAIWTKDFLLSFRPGETREQELAIDARIDWRVLAFTTAVAVLTGILFGLLPAWRATRVNLAADLKENASQHSSSNARITKALLVAQIALSLTLLIGAGLFLRTLRNLETVDAGFAQENLLLFKIQPELKGYKDDNVARLYAQISEQVEAIPGVRTVTHSMQSLIGEGGFAMPLTLSGGDKKADTGSWIHHVRYNFFDAMKMNLLAGRSFTAQDVLQSPKVAIINQAAAKKLFGNENPIGKRIGFGPDAKAVDIEIIGIVNNAKYDDLRKDAPPTTYFSAAQFTEYTAGQAVFAVRTAGNPIEVVGAIRAAIKSVDANLPITSIRTQTEQIAQTFSQEKLFAQLTTFFGLLTLALVSLGLYGMMSYTVTQRRREMGIRLALGAQAGTLLRMVLRQGMTVVLIGILFGGAMAWATTRLVSGFLFGVSPTNPLVFLATIFSLLVVALIACWIPAHRAANTDPMIALRCE